MHYKVPMRIYLLLSIGLVLLNISLYRAILFPSTLIRTAVVGKGMTTIIRTTHGKTLLIDTGSDAGVLRAIGTTLPMWERHLDGVILTGDDSKSRGGLPELAERYQFPEPLRYGVRGAPSYGTPVVFDGDTRITVIAPHTYTVSYGATTLAFSSSTPERTLRVK
ncbi:MAG TPA: hypothetical protein VF829_00580 [Candidatus Paceibacterota bacterium]